MNTKNLVSLLQKVGNGLDKQIILVAAGGTAMTLLELKNSTIDIDFTGPSNDIDLFMKVERTIPHGFHIDKYYDGRVYISQLPDDYLEKSIVIAENIKNISLRALQPLDIVVTKIARLNGRDWEDIKTCIDRCNLSNEDIRIRAQQVLEFYPGNEEVYKTNLSHVLDYDRHNKR